MRRNWIFPALGLLAALALIIGVFSDMYRGPKRAKNNGLRHIVFAIDWKAEAEYGGFYQAKALGLYKTRGLDVEIRAGGPNTNVPQLIAAGAVELGIGSNSFTALNMANVGVPAKAVLAVFQKDPQALITHPREDVRSIADMKGEPIMVADAVVSTIWIWLKAKFGFTDDQIRKYTFNLAPFLADKNAIQQGYVTSEPYTIEKMSGVRPQVYLFADEGYPGYGSLVMARDELIAKEPAVVKAFVAASIEGWKSYLYEDPTPANKLIKAANPEMSDDILFQAIDKMNSYHLLLADGANPKSIGQMTDERWRVFFETMSDEGVYPKSLDLKKAYSLDFLPPAGP
jgi:NitT/TauT family transport system substrate-binding protein